MTTSRRDKGKHLTSEDRHFIEDALNENYTLKLIAERLGKDPTTVSKEVKKNRIASLHKKDNMKVSCSNRKECNQKGLCSTSCNRLCKKCTTMNCYKHCPNYEVKKCTQLSQFPHVCNGCRQKTNCFHEKHHYRAKVAQANYKDVLTSCREGIGMTSDELNTLDGLISPLILKGQSIAHIFTHHKHEISCSERTLYNYFEMNAFAARNIDLPRKVRYKPRKKARLPKKSGAYRVGRTYEDFNAYIGANPGTSVVEMDTVIGRKGGKVLLTLFFRNCSLMIALLLDACSQACVLDAIDAIYDAIGNPIFKSCFPVILTDNGSEFQAPHALENDAHGNERTKLFYCDPMASYQKPHVEKNHEFIRYVIPKGKTFDHLAQDKITLMINHINSFSRSSLNSHTPFKLAQLLLNESLIESLSLELIPPDEVHLKPALLK
ncbi:MAG: IS30 family transposase [Erysipelotrichaceae bacterium]|nr:IS30 family transposase [Erysipelotrichaceae bacterium]